MAKRLQSGFKLRDMSAGDLNAAIEMAQNRRELINPPGPGNEPPPMGSPVVVQVRCGGDADIPAGSAVILTEPLITDESAPFNGLIFDAGARGSIPDPHHVLAFTLQPAKANEQNVVWAFIVGATWAKVNITDTSHTRAVLPLLSHIATPHHTLASSFGGGNEIYWKPSGTGEKWCIVLTRHPFQTFQLAVVTAITGGEPGYSAAGIAFDGTGTATLLDTLTEDGAVTDSASIGFVMSNRDAPIGVDDIIRVWASDGSKVMPGQPESLTSFMDQVVVYGEFFNATDHLRRLDGYETTVGVVKGLVAEEDQLYWSDEFLGVEGPPGPTGPAGPTGPPGADGEDGEDGDTVDEGYAIDLTVGPPRVISFDPTEITGFAAAFQFFRHLAADNDPNEPHWKTIGGFSAGASQMLWHQSDAWTFQTVTGYDDTSAKQLLGHIDGAWQWKTLVDWLKELPNYSAGSDQIIGHAAGGDPEWKTLTSKVINSPTAASLNLDADSLDLDINYTPVTVKLWPAASDGAGADFTDTVSVTECA